MPLHKDKSYVGFLISDTARLMRTIFDRRVREVGLTRSQWVVLRRLYRNPGINQSELAEMLEVEKASAGRLIDRLEKNGWVERQPDAADRRVNRLFLTPRAIRINDRIQPIADEMVEEALAGFSPEDRKRLTEVMTLMKARLQAMIETTVPETPEKRPSTARDTGEAAASALDLA